MANTSVIGAAFLKSQNIDPVPSADLMLELKPAGLLGVHKMMDSMNFKDDVFYTCKWDTVAVIKLFCFKVMHQIDPEGALGKEGCLAVTVTLMRPYSQGTMWLWRHSDGSYTPRMNPGYLSDSRDLSALVTGIVRTTDEVSFE